MKRGAPLQRRTRIKPRSTSRYRTRERDTARMIWTKQQPCCAAPIGPCSGPIEADHAGRRGYGQKAADSTVIALCQLHHRQRTDFSGPFRSWNQARMRAWLEDMVAEHQARYEGDVLVAFFGPAAVEVPW